MVLPSLQKSNRLPIGSVLVRAARRLLLCLAVVGSLLTFPSAVPWMIGFWFAWCTIPTLAAMSAWRKQCSLRWSGSLGQTWRAVRTN
jgi:hypothetical protein